MPTLRVGRISTFRIIHYQDDKKTSSPFQECIRRDLAVWGSSNFFSACFTGSLGFLETHLDGLCQLLTIPPRCVTHDELCNKIHGPAFFSVCHKDVADKVGTANWQEAKDR